MLAKIRSLVAQNKKPHYLNTFSYADSAGNKTEGYCEKHDHHFITATRNLTQPCRDGVTCPHCMRDAGEIDFYSWPEFIRLVNESEFPFQIENRAQF